MFSSNCVFHKLLGAQCTLVHFILDPKLKSSLFTSISGLCCWPCTWQSCTEITELETNLFLGNCNQCNKSDQNEWMCVLVAAHEQNNQTSTQVNVNFVCKNKMIFDSTYFSSKLAYLVTYDHYRRHIIVHQSEKSSFRFVDHMCCE